jgi:hypothetical protein
MNLRSPLETVDAFAVAVLEPIAVEPLSVPLLVARCAAGERIASLRAAGDAGDWLVVAVERLVLLGLAAPGPAFCAAAAAAKHRVKRLTLAGRQRR